MKEPLRSQRGLDESVKRFQERMALNKRMQAQALRETQALAWKIIWKELAAFRVLRAGRLLLLTLITSPPVARAARMAPRTFGRFVGFATRNATKWVSPRSLRGK